MIAEGIAPLSARWIRGAVENRGGRASVPTLKVHDIQHSIARDITAEVLAIEKELIVAISVGVVRDMRRHDDPGHVP
jgi:hypothetical protein